MYTPHIFREQDQEVLQRFLQEYSFATLLTWQEGAPFVSHLPLLYRPEPAPFGVLRGHMARANPHWKSFLPGAEALAIFSGPHCYISPSWYGTPLQVPTWNYLVVHMYGAPRVLEEEGERRALLEEMVEVYESHQEAPWSLSSLPPEFLEDLTRGVVAFEISVRRLLGKFKLNQNRTPEERTRVIEVLQKSEKGHEREVARWMSFGEEKKIKKI